MTKKPVNEVFTGFLFAAGPTGLEPAASCVTGRRSNQLSYNSVLLTRILGSSKQSRS